MTVAIRPRRSTARRRRWRAGTATESGRLHPYHAAREVMAALPPRTVGVFDGGEVPAWAGYHFAAEEPNSVLRLGYPGCLGVGQGFAIGAHRADPDRPVLLFTGDGSAAFHLSEFDTMVRHGIPVVTVVFTNAVWGMSIHGQQAVFGQSGVVVSELADSAYEQVAIAFGAYGERIERLEDIGPAVARAFASGRPVCLNIAVAAEPVHPTTTAMVGDVTATDLIVVPYYENIPIG
ncbi:thiamine pyrophosphate-dependent enzyme [Amycolatopsis sp. NPDC006125]